MNMMPKKKNFMSLCLNKQLFISYGTAKKGVSQNNYFLVVERYSRSRNL